MKRAIGVLSVFVMLVTLIATAAEEPSAPAAPLLGDVSSDGTLSADDALLTLQAATRRITLSDEEARRADANGDGAVTADDALLILQLATQKINTLPGEEAFSSTTSSTTTTTTTPVEEGYTPAYTAIAPLKLEAEEGLFPDTCSVLTHGTVTALGHTAAGDQYQYTLSVEREGYYLLSYQTSAIAEVALTLSVDGVERFTLHTVNNGEWRHYLPQHATEPLYLSPGTHTVVFTQQNAGMNFDWFSLVYLAEGSPEQIPADRQVSAAFTGAAIRTGYRLPLEIAGLTGDDSILQYIWFIGGQFTATTDRMAPTKMTIMEMEHIEVWPVIRIDDKTYYLHASASFDTPVYDPLPVITIDTEDFAPIVSKEDYINATMSITADGVAEEQLYDGLIEIRGRGNATWAYPKKPYKIKLDKKADLFGMGANKHWVLLANYRDRAFTRTQLAFELSEHMGLPTTRSVFVRVILNGEDAGVYQLCEQIRVGETRVDIMDWEDEVANAEDLSSLTSANGYDITGGFLIELNNYYDEVSRFTTDHDVKFTVKSPEYLNTNSEMFDYLVGYIQDFENAVYSDTFVNDKGQHYSDLFEVEDLVNYWIVNEFLGNLDSGRSGSTFMYKDIGGDKFHMGPVWDFDSSIGNYHGHHTECPPDRWVTGQQGKWYTQLYRDPTFVEQLYDRYWENREYLGTLVERAQDLHMALYAEAVTDHELWEIPTTFTYDGQVVVDWLQARLAFMDEQFASVETAYASLNR